jgi:hypothetical protein
MQGSRLRLTRAPRCREGVAPAVGETGPPRPATLLVHCYRLPCYCRIFSCLVKQLMPNASEKDLRAVSELSAARIQDLRFGASLVERTGYDVLSLIAKVSLDRVALGAALHRQARAALHGRPRSFRSAISRGYYAMYQTFRGVVFFVSRGDDFEDHSKLSQHLPKDFPQMPYWANALKDARLERNRADYEPYPRSDTAFAASAASIYKNSHQLRIAARAYLRGKGLKA